MIIQGLFQTDKLETKSGDIKPIVKQTLILTAVHRLIIVNIVEIISIDTHFVSIKHPFVKSVVSVDMLSFLFLSLEIILWSEMDKLN